MRNDYDAQIASAAAALAEATPRLEAAQAAREQAGDALEAARREFFEGRDTDTTKHDRLAHAYEAATELMREAEKTWHRAKSRHTALCLTRDRSAAMTEYWSTCKR